jgi:uncharacterized membrane protein
MSDFFKNFFRNRSRFAVVSWIIVIVYAATSINLLIDWYGHSGEYLNPRELVIFAMVSFLLVVIVAIYHLSSLFRRRRRRTDRQRLSRAKFVRAKHRLSPGSPR